MRDRRKGSRHRASGVRSAARSGGELMSETRSHGWDPEACTTLLFVPADRPDMLAKAQSRGADALVIDLEDAIAPTAKDAARGALRELLQSGALDGPSAICVRLNAVGE